MTDYAEVHTAVESMKLGSLDYIPKLLVEDKLPSCSATFRKNRTADNDVCPCSPVMAQHSEPS